MKSKLCIGLLVMLLVLAGASLADANLTPSDTGFHVPAIASSDAERYRAIKMLLYAVVIAIGIAKWAYNKWKPGPKRGHGNVPATSTGPSTSPPAPPPPPPLKTASRPTSRGGGKRKWFGSILTWLQARRRRDLMIGGLLLLAFIVVAVWPSSSFNLYVLSQPEEKQVFEIETTGRMKNLSVRFFQDGEEYVETAEVRINKELEILIGAVDDGQLTAYEQLVETSAVDFRYDTPDGVQTDSQRSPLEGETVRFFNDGRRWNADIFGPVTHEQSEEVRTEPAKFALFRSLYPKETISVGHEWSVDADEIVPFVWPSFLRSSGGADLRFGHVATIAGIRCAVVNATFELAVTSDSDEGSVQTEIEGKTTIYQSLDSAAIPEYWIDATIRSVVGSGENRVVYSGDLHLDSKRKLRD